MDDFRCPSVTAFLAMLRNLHPELEWKCLHGSCFRLYLLLKEVWPDAEAWTNVNHVITKIDGRFYDIRGEVASTGYTPMMNEPAMYNRAYYWGTEIQDRMIERRMRRRKMRTAKSRSIVWTGDNLRDVIRVIGLHPSVSRRSWDEYAEVVRSQGLKVFTNTGQVMAKVGDIIQKHADGDVSVIGTQRETCSKPATPTKNTQDIGRPITRAEAIATAREILRAAEQARREAE